MKAWNDIYREMSAFKIDLIDTHYVKSKFNIPNYML